MLDGRNTAPLAETTVERCVQAWEVLGGPAVCPLIVAGHDQLGARTRYIENDRCVMLGPDVLPGDGVTARSRLSYLACLAHELAHATRHAKGYDRPTALPHSLLDEAEASLDASFNPVISAFDRRDLVQDAGEQITRWLAEH